MVDARYWIWLQTVLGPGNPKVDQVYHTFGTPEPLFGMSEKELTQTGIFTPKEIKALLKVRLEQAERNLEKAQRHRCVVLTPDHPDFPESLTNIPGIPCVLYVRGNVNLLKERLRITMVGTRNATAYGDRCAQWLARELAAAGCVICSGLAVGIDSACHEGALQVNGDTIGFLACGMDVNYPSASAGLKRRILNAGGALVTEFPFGERPLRGNFNIRNRLLAGLSAGVVVVQAPKSSGALNTARHALEQNRDVFAVPGEIGDLQMEGCNQLIAEGAVLVQNAGSILSEYEGRFPEWIRPYRPVMFLRPTKQTSQPVAEESLKVAAAPAAETIYPMKPPCRLSEEQLEGLGLSADAKTVYQFLEETAVGCDLLAVRTGFDTARILAALTELELNDLAQVQPGGHYCLSKTD